jgi:hypothetical protein
MLEIKMKKDKKELLILLFSSFLFYIILNEFFFQASLIISERKLVLFPYLFGGACGKPGYDSKGIILTVSFLVLRLLSIWGYNTYFSKYSQLNLFVGAYVITDFLRVMLGLISIGIKWDTYFYSAFPILKFRMMSDFSSEICFGVTGLLGLSVYVLTTKTNLKLFSHYFLSAIISFLLYFLLIYIFLGKLFML